MAEKAEIQKNISKHTARHAFAYLMVAKNVNPFIMKELLGHSDIRVTQIYVKASKANKDKAIDALDNLDDITNLLLTAEDVCRILRVCPRTLQNYRTDGKLKFYKFNRKKIMYRVGDVANFVKRSSCSSLRKDMLECVLNTKIKILYNNILKI